VVPFSRSMSAPIGEIALGMIKFTSGRVRRPHAGRPGDRSAALAERMTTQQLNPIT
jgi:hypothetical protein